MGWVAAAVAVVSAVATVAGSRKAASSVKSQAANQASIAHHQAYQQAELADKQAKAQAEEADRQVKEQASLAEKLAKEQAALAETLAKEQAALAEKQARDQVVAANLQAQEQAAFELGRGKTEADLIRATAEANANQVELAAADEARVLYEQQRQWMGVATARAAASGFTLSGSPSFYMEEADRLYVEDLSWRNRIATADAVGLRWEGKTRADIGLWASGEAAKALVRTTYDTTLRQYQQGVEVNRQEVEGIVTRNKQEVDAIKARLDQGVSHTTAKNKQELELIAERNRQEVEHIRQRAEAGVDAANAQASSIRTQGFTSALNTLGNGLAAFSSAGGFKNSFSAGEIVSAKLSPTSSGASGIGFDVGNSGVGFAPKFTTSTSWLRP